MVEFDFLQIAIHGLNILLLGGFVFICVVVYRYLSKKLSTRRRSN